MSRNASSSLNPRWWPGLARQSLALTPTTASLLPSLASMGRRRKGIDLSVDFSLPFRGRQRGRISVLSYDAINNLSPG